MLKIQWSRSTNMRPLMISYHRSQLRTQGLPSAGKKETLRMGLETSEKFKADKKTTRIYVALRHQLGIFRVQSLRRVVVTAVS